MSFDCQLFVEISYKLATSLRSLEARRAGSRIRRLHELFFRSVFVLDSGHIAYQRWLLLLLGNAGADAVRRIERVRDDLD